MPHPQNRHGVLHLKNSWPLRPASVHCILRLSSSLRHSKCSFFNTWAFPWPSPDQAGSIDNGDIPMLAASVLTISHMMVVPLGRTLHVDPQAYTLITVHPPSWSAQTAIKLAVTHVHWNAVHVALAHDVSKLVFIETISWMTYNSRNSRKFRPAKFKRDTVCQHVYMHLHLFLLCLVITE